MLKSEQNQHLGYEKHSKNNENGNRGNGSSKKTLRSDFGEIEISIPRDRTGEFEPKVVKNMERTSVLPDEKIISMYLRGLSVRDIKTHIEEIYGVDISCIFYQ